MDVPTSESVMNTYATPSSRGQGIYLAADLRAGTNARNSMFWQDPNRYNGDLWNQVETSLGKLVGYNGQLPYNGPINWNNNITGRGVRSTSTQQVSMRDLSNYTVSNTVKENLGLSGLLVAHSASASSIRAYYAPYPIASWTSGSSFGTGSAGGFGVIAYKNNVNRPRLASFEQNNTVFQSGLNSANILYGVPTSTGSNGGDLNFNVVFNNSSVGLGNTAESVIATTPNIIIYPGTSSAAVPALSSLAYKRQGLLIYSNLGGDSGKLYYNRYILSQSNASGLGLSLEVGATTKLPNNDQNNCVLGLVSEFNSFGVTNNSIPVKGNFSVPYTFIDTSYSDISSATLLFTNGLGWYARVLSMTGSALYTGSSFYLGGGRYPACWRNENGAQMKSGYSIVGSLGAPIANTNPDESIILGYQYPYYFKPGAGVPPSQSQWAADPGNLEWYRFDTGSQQIDTIIVSGSRKWQSKAIEYLGALTISGSSQNGGVVVVAMAHTGSSIDVGLYMRTGSSFVQLDYLAGVGGGNVDSTDRITLQRMNAYWQSGEIGTPSSGEMMNVYNSPGTSSVSSSGFVGMVYSTNDPDPATKVVYLRINAHTLKFEGTSSLPTDTYGPYAVLGGGYDTFYPHYPMISYLEGNIPWEGYYNIGWEQVSIDDPLTGGPIGPNQVDNNVPIYPLIGSYYDINAGTSEIKISSIALY